jgi:hypothetical protein
MRKLLLAGIAALALVSSAYAHTEENTLFTCVGTIEDEVNGVYAIVDKSPGADEYPMTCYFDKGRISKQILRVCHIGKSCVVSAKGETGNANAYMIFKVFEAKRPTCDGKICPEE